MPYALAAGVALLAPAIAAVAGDSPDSLSLAGSKIFTMHHVKNVVGPSLHIDEAGIIAAAWVEEEADGRTIYFAKSEKPGAPLNKPVRVNQPGEVPYFRQEAPALAIRGQDVFMTWAMTHPKMSADKPFSSELRLSRSHDGGTTFAPSVRVNDDDQITNHTFDSIHVGPDGAVHVAWIDGRDGKKSLPPLWRDRPTTGMP